MKQVTRTPIKIDEKYKKLVDPRKFYEQEKRTSKCYGVACSSVDETCRSQCKVLAECEAKCNERPPVYLTAIEFNDLMDMLNLGAAYVAQPVTQQNRFVRPILKGSTDLIRMLLKAKSRSRRGSA